MVDSENKVPGISFRLAGETSHLRSDGMTHIECKLIGEYNDEELWKKIKQRLMDGFRIYSEEDFQGEVLLVMRDDYHNEQKAHEVTKHSLKLEVARRIKLEEELTRLKNLIGTLGTGLGKR